MKLKDEILNCESLSAIASEDAKQAAESKHIADEAWHNLRMRMEDEEIDSLTVSGTKYTRAQTDKAVVQDKQTFVDWARENAAHLVEGEPRKKLLNELIQQRLADGQELPPGIGFYPHQYVSRRTS